MDKLDPSTNALEHAEKKDLWREMSRIMYFTKLQT